MNRRIYTGLALAVAAGLTGIVACGNADPADQMAPQAAGGNMSPTDTPSVNANPGQNPGQAGNPQNPQHPFQITDCSPADSVSIMRAMNNAAIDRYRFVSGATQNPDIKKLADDELKYHQDIDKKLSDAIKSSNVQPTENDISQAIAMTAQSELQNLQQVYMQTPVTVITGVMPTDGLETITQIGPTGQVATVGPLPNVGQLPNAPCQGGANPPQNPNEAQNPGNVPPQGVAPVSPGDRAFLADAILETSKSLGFLHYVTDSMQHQGGHGQQNPAHGGAPNAQQGAPSLPQIAGGAIQQAQKHLQDAFQLQANAVGACGAQPTPGACATPGGAGQQQPPGQPQQPQQPHPANQ